MVSVLWRPPGLHLPSQLPTIAPTPLYAGIFGDAVLGCVGFVCVVWHPTSANAIAHAAIHVADFVIVALSSHIMDSPVNPVRFTRAWTAIRGEFAPVRERTDYLDRNSTATSPALALVIITAGTKVTGGTGSPERKRATLSAARSPIL